MSEQLQRIAPDQWPTMARVGHAALAEAGYACPRCEDGNTVLVGVPPQVAYRAYLMAHLAVGRVPFYATFEEYLARPGMGWQQQADGVVLR